MSVAQSFLPEFDAEMASTRRLLERVPADRLGWKPHAKSRSLGELATHVTELPRWGTRIQGKDSFQIGSEKAPTMSSAADYLSRFDSNVAASRTAIEGEPDDKMGESFQVIKPDGSPFFSISRKDAIRRVLLNHVIHHRAQLGVYLRLLDVPLPTIYGPTADESI
jgi:uncharacterized damage-inducible protein DinB